MDFEEPDFMFSADGDLVQLTPAAIRSETPAIPGGTGASARVRREHEEGLQGDAQVSLLPSLTCFSVRLHFLSRLLLLFAPCFESRIKLHSHLNTFHDLSPYFEG
jgi:hypothetical protein